MIESRCEMNPGHFMSQLKNDLVKNFLVKLLFITDLQDGPTRLKPTSGASYNRGPF